MSAMIDDSEEVEEYSEPEEYEEPEETSDPKDSALKARISETPFEELLKLRDTLGTKLFSETIEKQNNVFKDKDLEFRRVNKNRPQEMSSKRPVQQLRQVFAIPKRNREDNERRDPRFDEQCGHYSQNVFNKTYGFVSELRNKSLIDLKKVLKNTKNEEKKQKLNFLLQRLQNQKLSEEMNEKKKSIETKVRNQLKDEMNDKNSFVNKSTLKRLELVEKFKTLKKSGKLKKYLEKKRKRNANRDQKRLHSNH